MRNILISLLLIGLFHPLSAGEPRVVIETGMTGPLAFSIEDLRTGFIFTGGEDGILRVWDTKEGNIVYAVRLSRHPLRMATIHPKKSEIGVVTSNSLNSFILTLWDWKEKEMKGSQELAEFPLFLKYAPRGNFLVYGITEWRSLTFLDTTNNTLLPYLTEGFGIVSDALISGSGETILTYSPSGALQYWNIREGKLKKKVATLANLSHINFVPGGRYMIAARDKDILLVDLLTGVPRDTINLPEIQHLKLDSSGKSVVAYNEENGKARLSTYKITGFTLSQSRNYTNLGIRQINTLLPREETIFLSLPSGEVKRFSLSSGSLETFASPTLHPIEDMAATPSTLLLGTSTGLIVLDTAILSGEVPLNTKYFLPKKEKLPFSGSSTGILAYDEDLFLLYTKEGIPGSLALFSPEKGIQTIYSDYPYAFTTVDAWDSRVTTLDRRGDIRIIDMETGEMSFQFSSFGIHTVIRIDETTLIAGRGRNSTISTPLLHLNTVTGETVPIADTNLLTFHLGYNPFNRKLYSLGIEDQHGKSQTVLKSHGGREFEKVEPLVATWGENLDAHLLVERGDAKIFTSLGSLGIHVLQGGEPTAFEESLNLPGKIISMGDYLVVLNREGSLGFWKKETGKEAFTIFLFQGGNWLVLYPNGQFKSSPGGEHYLSLYDGTSTRRLVKEDLRVPDE